VPIYQWHCKRTLENTEGAIEKGQSRETDSIGAQDEETQNKNITQSEAVNQRRTNNTMGKRTNNNLQNTTQKAQIDPH
jgi:hypothetical protein